MTQTIPVGALVQIESENLPHDDDGARVLYKGTVLAVSEGVARVRITAGDPLLHQEINAEVSECTVLKPS